MYANVIIDRSVETLDRIFQYKIPDDILESVKPGTQLMLPFGNGNRIIKGYVVGMTDHPDIDEDKIKFAAGICADSVLAESRLIELAWWMKEKYGSTMNQALKTVLPVKQKVKQKEVRYYYCTCSENELIELKNDAEKKHYKARIRLYEAFLQMPVISSKILAEQFDISASILKPLIDRKIIKSETVLQYRNPVTEKKSLDVLLELNQEQKRITEDFKEKYQRGIRDVSLIHGVTGSGKTEVYMEMIDTVLSYGKQVIMLIPEIALTYQTVLRFYKRFGNRISIINSRLSAGERYDQFERAKNGDIDIMIGPRSALFTPFKNLGLIIIDEEHENAYKSEVTPRYHAREVAQKWAQMNDASLVLGSATPSLEAYTKALAGQYQLYQLNCRAKADSILADVKIVDLRRELKEGNRSMFSRELQWKIEDRLSKKEQIILFINRRGFANFVSCRECGEAIKCPHCDVTLKLHNDGKLKCHYCGYEIRMPEKCPSCGSKYIANFGTGTQKVEQQIQKMYPECRTIRMDLDTTVKKGSHEKLLSAFRDHQADILIGTQMIVKGHDFPEVTLVGIIAADLSLYISDYRASENTFQLLTQAAGRAGRDCKKGEVIIQTYAPDHFSIQAAAKQDYKMFYEKEMNYRRCMHYPPSCFMLTVQFSSKNENYLNAATKELINILEQNRLLQESEWIGPVDASVYKINDIYRKILYIKNGNYDILTKIKDFIDQYHSMRKSDQWNIQYDFT